jgi:hypothetical protein
LRKEKARQITLNFEADPKPSPPYPLIDLPDENPNLPSTSLATHHNLPRSNAIEHPPPNAFIARPSSERNQDPPISNNSDGWRRPGNTCMPTSPAMGGTLTGASATPTHSGTAPLATASNGGSQSASIPPPLLDVQAPVPLPAAPSVDAIATLQPLSHPTIRPPPQDVLAPIPTPAAPPQQSLQSNEPLEQAQMTGQGQGCGGGGSTVRAGVRGCDATPGAGIQSGHGKGSTAIASAPITSLPALSRHTSLTKEPIGVPTTIQATLVLTILISTTPLPTTPPPPPTMEQLTTLDIQATPTRSRTSHLK